MGKHDFREEDDEKRVGREPFTRFFASAAETAPLLAACLADEMPRFEVVGGFTSASRVR